MHSDSGSNKTIISFEDVSKIYPQEGEAALHGVSFSVQEGEFVVLIGPSGCGKTTILKLIAGLELPTSGVVKKPNKVAMTFQSGALLPWLTVFDNVAFGMRAQGIGERTITRQVDYYISMIKLSEYRDRYPIELSGGQRQRVGIARALAVEPAVLLMDEPFSALDAKTTAELHDDIIEVWRKTNKTIVLVSHLIEEAVSLADKILLMKKGGLEKEYRISLPYPRREQEMGFSKHVLEIRKEFFK